VAIGTPFAARGSLLGELDRIVVLHDVPRTSDIEFTRQKWNRVRDYAGPASAIHT
jgi:hypothetical protein